MGKRNQNQLFKVLLFVNLYFWGTSGIRVPHGSNLRPLLFILFINDMPLSCFSSKTGLFADDAKIYMEIKNNLDCTLLQADF